MGTILANIGKKILLSLLTEAVMKKLVSLMLRKLAESTKNKVDDEIVKVVEEALK